jgi:hypothetical protein
LSISRAGDFNGDGFDDFVVAGVSALGSSTINVIFGQSTAFSPPNVNLSPLPYKGVRYFTGKADLGGWSVSGGVDLNQDGFDDILIGAPFANSYHGNAYVIFGSASPVDSSISQLGNFNGITFNASLSSNNGFGWAVALEKNTRGLFVTSVPPVQATSFLYYLHDFVRTAAPSVSPTFSPSAPPTCEPTHSPSAIPSAFPTVSPSVSPTEAPSVVPSFLPTFPPSNEPTFIPSVTPTFTPTRTPSVVTTESPTVTPTQTPTLVPSVAPTMTPTQVPTIVPSFRPSAPDITVLTAVPTVRTKSSIKLSAGFILNSVASEPLSATTRRSITSSGFAVNGATLSPTSQETIKQSIANASQTTVNNVDLVSVTRTNRRLLSSSVVHRMLATVPLFSYKVVAEIHFNLIDFPGLNESYVAGTKSNILSKAITTHEFDRIISYYATVNHASELMNVSASDVTITTSVSPAPDDSSSGSKQDLTVGEIVGIAVSALVGAFLLTVLIYFAVVQSRSQSEVRRSIPAIELDYTPVAISERVARSDNAMVDITKVYEDSSDKEFDRFKKLQMTAASTDVVKL